MAKSKTEIHVTTVFDGELDAADVFREPDCPKIWAEYRQRKPCENTRYRSIIKIRFRRTVFRLDCAGKRL